MSKKVELSAEERAEFVLRMLRKEEPAVQIARRAGIAEATLYRWRDEFIKAGRQALNGSESLVGKETARLQGQVAEREQVIGELQRTLGQLSLSGELRSMISEAIETAEPPARLNRVLRALGVAVSMWYGKRREEPKKPGRKPQPIPETLAAQIRWW